MINPLTNKKIEELFQIFHDHNVEFVIAGGCAVNFHGHVRSTKDIDVAIDRTAGDSIIKSLKNGEYLFQH